MVNNVLNEKLTSISDDLSKYTFVDDKLTEIDYSSLNLESLPEGIFSSLYELKKLDLSYNHLTTLNSAIFDDLEELKELS